MVQIGPTFSLYFKLSLILPSSLLSKPSDQLCENFNQFFFGGFLTESGDCCIIHHNHFGGAGKANTAFTNMGVPGQKEVKFEILQE